MRWLSIISLGLLLSCGAASRPDNSTPVGDDLDVRDPPLRHGPAERLRPLPPDRSPAYAPRSPRTSTRRFRGRRVDLDVKDADLHNVFRLLADVGNVNVVVGDGVAGSVTLRVRDVPWDQILDTIVRTQGLHMEQSGNVIMIMARKPD